MGVCSCVVNSAGEVSSVESVKFETSWTFFCRGSVLNFNNLRLLAKISPNYSHFPLVQCEKKQKAVLPVLDDCVSVTLGRLLFSDAGQSTRHWNVSVTQNFAV